MTAGCGRHKQKPNPRYHVTSRGEREGVSCVRREGEGKMRSSSRDQNVNRWKLFRYLEIEQQSKWVEGLEDNAQFTNCCSSFPFLLYLADADVGPLCMVWGCNKIFLYRPVIDTTAWHGDPTPQHNTTQSGLSCIQTLPRLTLSLGLLEFLTQRDIFPNLSNWGSGDNTKPVNDIVIPVMTHGECYEVITCL